MALISLYCMTIMATDVSAMELSIIEGSLIDNKRGFYFIDYNPQRNFHVYSPMSGL